MWLMLIPREVVLFRTMMHTTNNQTPDMCNLMSANQTMIFCV